MSRGLDTSKQRSRRESGTFHTPDGGVYESTGDEQCESRTAPSSALLDNIPTPDTCDPDARREQEKTAEPRVQPQYGPPSDSETVHTDANDEVIITSIRATNIAFGLRRVPAGFYVALHHSGSEWRTENKPSSANHDVVEWTGAIPVPSTLSGNIRLEVYASFELQPMLGTGEQVRKLTVTVKQLLDRNDVPFTFFPKAGDVVSPCSAISVAVERQKHESGNSSRLVVRRLQYPTTESRGELEDATNEGHRALSRYRKHGERRDLDRSIEEFERALRICPLDHPCRAASQSNLATAKFILCQVDNTYTSIGVPLNLYRDALSARPVGHVDRPSTLVHLAAVYLARFERLRGEVDGAQTEGLLREAIQLSPPESHENRAAAFMLQLHAGRRTEHDSSSPSTDKDLGVLSLQFLHRFERFGDLADLERVITLLKELIRSTSIWNEWYCAARGNLGAALLHRFRHLGEQSDLEDSISTLKDAVDLTPHGHPDKSCYLSNLGTSLRARFERYGELSNLEEAISTLKDAFDLAPHGHPAKPVCLNSLGTSFITRFLRLGELSDLEHAISVLKGAVDLTPDNHPHKPICLNNLANCFLVRFDHLGELSDLKEAISRQRDADEVIPLDHPAKATSLNNLGIAFLDRFQYFGEPGDLDNAISILSDAIHLLPHDHPDRPRHLNILGTSFITRFRHLGELSDLEKAVSVFRNAVDLTPNGHHLKPGYLGTLGYSFRICFEHFGKLSDLEDAILTLRGAVDLTPCGHLNKPSCLANLGNSFLTRFQHLGELSDLENAISMLRDALDLTPDGDPGKPQRLGNFSNTLKARFESLGELNDLEHAISTLKDAIHLTPDGSPQKPVHLNNLGSCFKTRFGHLGELGDLELAISRQMDAVDLSSRGHSVKPVCLDGLGTSFFARFQCLGVLSNLEDAISRQRDAISLTPDGHPDKPKRLVNLGNSLLAWFQCTGERSALEHAICLYFRAASAPFGPVRDRFVASQHWISCARHTHHHTLLHAYSVAINLLPQLPWIGLSLERRYSELAQGANVVREAAAAALDAGLPETAVEWLERGRSIVWGELFQLRSSYDELSSAHPDHARRLRELSAALDRASAAREKSLSALSELTQSASILTPESLEQEANRHRALAIRRDKLLQEIRGLPGFEGFLGHKQFSQLRASAHAGPVVILNAAETRCDALVILADVDHVIHVPLPKFTFKRSSGLQSMLEKLLGHARVAHVDERVGRSATLGGVSWESLLSILWRDVVKHVLDALAFSSPGELSRIFWCPTGPFVFLPIHAAGLYDTQYSQPGHKVFDFVVSSYIPTLSILSPSPTLAVLPSDNLCLLVVRQPPSDGLSRLPGVVTELRHIRAVIRNSPSAHTTLLESSAGTVEEVLAMMREADWVHFACHGIQDTGNPTNSGLCLADGRRLKLRDIIALSRPHGGLAFLSACQTATGDERLSDEAIHTAAGMLFAGYGGVIGTMWSISDKLAPEVAWDVYTQLFRCGTRPDYREAARALHETIGRVRDSGKASFVTWLPFIHVGL